MIASVREIKSARSMFNMVQCVLVHMPSQASLKGRAIMGGRTLPITRKDLYEVNKPKPASYLCILSHLENDIINTRQGRKSTINR